MCTNRGQLCIELQGCDIFNAELSLASLRNSHTLTSSKGELCVVARDRTLPLMFSVPNLKVHISVLPYQVPIG